VSDRGMPGRDRRKLTEALAQLSQGLREGDDPLYDPWKSDAESTSGVPLGPELARSSSAGRLTVAAPSAIPARGRTLPAVPWWVLVIATAALLWALSAAFLVALDGPKQ
jgi:hypothetical protein